MVSYKLENKHRFLGKSSSKGSQVKYIKEGYYYKLGTPESICEYLATKVLENSTLPASCYVSYERCLINGFVGCRSKSFLGKNGSFISIERLYESFVGRKGFSNEIMCLGSSRERLDCILSLVKRSTGIENYFVYMKTMLLVYMLLLNCDRHTNNYGVVYNSVFCAYRIPPMFDFGLSLKEGMSSCTISGSFEDQVVACGYPIISTFKIDYSKLNASISHSSCKNTEEVKLLKSQLKRYERVFHG